ncbi:MAG: hypothetical protein ACI9JM_000862 [Halioglobus sp.]
MVNIQAIIMTAPGLSEDALNARNLDLDHDSLAQRMEDFRHRMPSNQVPLVIPVEGDPQAPDEYQVPEIEAANLTAESLKSSLAEHGALIVRGMFPETVMQPMTAAIDGVLDACDSTRKVKANLVSPYFNPPSNLVSVMPNGIEDLAALRLFSKIGGSALCVESPSVAELLLQFYEDHGLKDLVAQYLGEPPCLSVKKWVLRRSELPMDEAGWHQDGAFMGTEINTLNLWIPLTHCGGETGAPGMDLIPQRLNKISSADGAAFDWAVSDDEARGGSDYAPAVAPEFNVGDALFFDHFYLHRTQYRPDINKRRYAIESWFFGTTTFPKDQVPIAW